MGARKEAQQRTGAHEGDTQAETEKKKRMASAIFHGLSKITPERCIPFNCCKRTVFLTTVNPQVA